MKSYEKLNIAINKLKSKVSASESKSKSLFKKITEAAEYVDPDVKSQIDDIIGTLKDENFYNKDSRRKFVNHLHNLITLENESPEARQSVKKFVKYVSDAITEYEIDIADDSDIVDSENIVAEEIKNKERMKNMRMKSEGKLTESVTKAIGLLRPVLRRLNLTGSDFIVIPDKESKHDMNFSDYGHELYYSNNEGEDVFIYIYDDALQVIQGYKTLLDEPNVFENESDSIKFISYFLSMSENNVARSLNENKKLQERIKFNEDTFYTQMVIEGPYSEMAFISKHSSKFIISDNELVQSIKDSNEQFMLYGLIYKRQPRMEDIFTIMSGRKPSGVSEMTLFHDSYFTESKNKTSKQKLNEGEKIWYRTDNVGSSKYTVSYHDGKTKNRDGSNFYGIKVFRNKIDMNSFINELVKQGYRERRFGENKLNSTQKLEQALSKVKSYLPEAIHLDKSDITYVDRQLEKLLPVESPSFVYIRMQNENGKTFDFSLNPAFLMQLIYFYYRNFELETPIPVFVTTFIKNFSKKYFIYKNEDKSYYENQFEKLLPITDTPISVRVNKFWFNLNWEFIISLCKFYEENFASFTESRNLKEAELWLGDVEVKKHPPEGLFATGSAKDIASWAKRSHDDLQSAMSSLNFYLNRAGENISSDDKNRIENAKEILRGLYESILREKRMDTEMFLNKIDKKTRNEILQSIADHYGISSEEAYEEVIDDEAEHLLDYMTDPQRRATHLLMKRYGAI